MAAAVLAVCVEVAFQLAAAPPDPWSVEEAADG
jgi:hypothetical protein